MNKPSTAPAAPVYDGSAATIALDTDKKGSSSRGIHSSGATVFTPKVKIVIEKGDPAQPQESKTDNQYAYQNEETYADMVKNLETRSSGAFVLIAAVVVLFVIGALLATKMILNNNHQKMVEEAESRQ